jgi:hypothetical protein
VGGGGGGGGKVEMIKAIAAGRGVYQGNNYSSAMAKVGSGNEHLKLSSLHVFSWSYAVFTELCYTSGQYPLPDVNACSTERL